MKKPTSQKSSITGRGQKCWLDWEDALNDCCRNLITLGELLADAGRNDVVMKSELVNNTGALIEREARQLQALVKNHPQL